MGHGSRSSEDSAADSEDCGCLVQGFAGGNKLSKWVRDHSLVVFLERMVLFFF